MQSDETRRVEARIRELAQKLATPTIIKEPEREKEDIEDTWTVEQKMQKRLYWLGLSEKEATRVVGRVKALPGMDPMKYRWNAYAESAVMKPLFTSLWWQAMAETVKWMLENKPDHRAWWLFTEKPQRKLKTENRVGNNSLTAGPKN